MLIQLLRGVLALLESATPTWKVPFYLVSLLWGILIFCRHCTFTKIIYTSFIFLKGILTENSYVHSIYYGCWQFILFWGILGNSREFPDIPWTHVRCLSPPLPLSEWENCPGPRPRISKIFGERHYLSPKWFFPPQPEIPQNIFIKLSPSPPRPQNLGKGTSFPKFRGHGWPH